MVYNDNNADNTTADKSITFQNQYVNDVFTTAMTSDEETPTPGTITDKEKAMYQASITAPVKQPAEQIIQKRHFNNETDSLAFSVEAISEESTVKQSTLYMKDSNQSDYKEL